MQITENKRGKVTVLELDGRLDTGTSAELDKRLMSLLNSGEKYFVLDLARLTYVSSAGLRVLLMGAKKISCCRRKNGSCQPPGFGPGSI